MIEQVTALGVRVQAGGGLSEAGVARALEQGAARAILGAAALDDPEAPARAVARHGERVGVGIDVHGDVVAPRGSGRLGPPVATVLRHLAEIQPAFVVFTNVERDGRMAGPDIAGLSHVADAVGSPVVASGGIRSIEDLLAVADLDGVTGAIVGRALEEEAFSVKDALAAVGD
jgi:phosphoribosylformimino-5-aminoimidazole carboxamide ribonucleotide (ProFAR) isomerase